MGFSACAKEILAFANYPGAGFARGAGRFE